MRPWLFLAGVVLSASIGAAAARWFAQTAQQIEPRRDDVARLRKEIDSIKRQIEALRVEAAREAPGGWSPAGRDAGRSGPDPGEDFAASRGSDPGNPWEPPPSWDPPAHAPGPAPSGGPSRRDAERERRREEERKVQAQLRQEYVEALSLNDAQVAEIEKAYRNASEARSSLREEVRSGRVKLLDALGRVEEIWRERDGQIQRALYPEQYQSFQDLERKRRQSGWMIGGSRGGPFESTRR